MATRSRLDGGLKRALDVMGAVTGLVVLSPVIAWAALSLLLTQGRPVLFRQERPGLHARPFSILKFRTMRIPRAGQAQFGTDDERVTRIGRILRSTSIDELPELWNVLRGEMSLVGPRPLLVPYLEAYTAEEARRHEMRPGITGWAAINGRHAARFEDRLQLDVWYVDHWSVALDLRILARTVSQVLRRTDVSATQDPTEIALPARFADRLREAEAAPSGHGGGTAAVRAKEADQRTE